MQAELSISNDNCDAQVQPTTRENQDGNLVKMVYTFSTNQTKNNLNTTSKGSNASDSNASYGFQRGNMMFTSTPPFRNRLGVQDSGYNSDHLISSNTPSQNSARTYQPYDRRCKSTCSITLSTDFNIETNAAKNVPNPSNVPCDLCRPCYFVERIRCTPECDECKRSHSLPRGGNTYSTHFCTKLPEKQQCAPFGTKDMMTQTVETREKCTSPLEKIQETNNDNKSDSELNKCRKKNVRSSSNRKKSSNVVRRYSDLGEQNKSVSTFFFLFF